MRRFSDVKLCSSEVPDPEIDERNSTEIANVIYSFVKGE